MLYVKYLFLISCIGLVISGSVYADSLSLDMSRRVKDKVTSQVRMFDLQNVKLLDSEFKTAMEHNAKWLLDLEPDRFLAWFRKEAGLTPKGKVYGGWESNTIAGHSLGHYMTALALMYSDTGDQEYKDRCDYIVAELAACQEAHDSGYMSAFPGGKECFEKIRRGEISSGGFDLNGIWVPWYTQHKLMAGLIDIYDATGSQEALDVLVKHADWIVDVVFNLGDEKWQKMLACEHGGISESFAELYSITGDEKYLDVSKKFYQKLVLDPLSRRENSLTGRHSNTQIPKIIACSRIYELTGDEKFHTISDYFWGLVVRHYSYANGGNSAEEYFGRPDVLGAKMHDTTETCNTYNMLKLTRHLFCLDPQASYMDYYERSLINHILTHQHPERGGALVYKGFLDMPARKGYSHPTDSFWCCVGTGMENHTKYADTIYSYSEDGTLYVNLFISSKLEYKGLNVKQISALPQTGKTVLEFLDADGLKRLKIRKPYWASGMKILVNNKPQNLMVASDGYIKISGNFSNGDKVEVTFDMSLRIDSLPDMPHRASIMYGPTLLAAQLKRAQQPPLIVSDSPEKLLNDVTNKGGLDFELSGVAYQPTDSGFIPVTLEYIPLYEVADQYYSIYLDIVDSKQWQTKQEELAKELLKKAELEAKTTDYIALGQMQAERDHNLTSEGRSDIGAFNGKNWRDTHSGWFEFDMKVDSQTAHQLICTYWGSDRGRREFDLLVDGEVVGTQVLNNNKPDSFFDVAYDIPVELTKGKTSIRVRLQAHPNSYGGGLFEARVIKKQSQK